MLDDFRRHEAGLTSPAERADSITPSDTTDLPRATRALYVGVGGDVVLRMLSGSTVTFTGMQGGMIYPLRIARVLQTGTSATGLVGLS